MDESQKTDNGISRKTIKAVGCICVCVVLAPVIFVGGATVFIMINWAWRDVPRSGEHLATAEEYSQHATNYSYYNRLLHQVCEFDIPEDAFLEMCKVKGYRHPVLIETLADLPRDETDSWPRINENRNVPVTIRRYVWHEPQHENCHPSVPDCQVDPTGKTDASCFHSVSRGYYYEIRGEDGGGIKIVYDAENGRCYIHSSPH